MDAVPSAYERVLEAVGSAVVAGELPVGAVDTVDRIESRTGASRSIVREAVRVLVGLGLLTAGRRVGLTVCPRDQWNVLDPRVIRWRLRSDREDQLLELLELRRAVEPAAARQAAERRTDDEAERLRSIADELRAAAGLGGSAFLEADRQLHRAMLRASGNALFVRLGGVIDEALRDRAEGEQAIARPASRDVALHGLMAAAIADADAEGAEAAMREIVELTDPTP
ncbi:FadR/GntR family transcriptional regulator [Microlunatus soli]|uniref:DNA-binding transcriptional regulator, FadR family n=1 Tax=Microlunatus soli TaxID=630515 RepID=A0A1H1VJP9_9ACTN|nr:FCD domain-containing protein [Microlunatus soli]SDS85108.1 DNA-binding transcriptional regulator, FadR family [Microlunatus soli]